MSNLDDARQEKGDWYGARPHANVMAHHNTFEVMSCASVQSRNGSGASLDLICLWDTKTFSVWSNYSGFSIGNCRSRATSDHD